MDSDKYVKKSIKQSLLSSGEGTGPACRTVRAGRGEVKEGIDYYLENGMMVFTSTYHLKRGHCCKNKCRHCPYGLSEKIPSSKSPE
ncbi:MAG: hypothetical protein JNM78_00440 [Cyclobacteriaceae bacterium]|nr:hypothetical protein [Cyclobacteriaceae bacterium]